MSIYAVLHGLQHPHEGRGWQVQAMDEKVIMLYTDWQITGRERESKRLARGRRQAPGHRFVRHYAADLGEVRWGSRRSAADGSTATQRDNTSALDCNCNHGGRLPDERDENWIPGADHGRSMN